MQVQVLSGAPARRELRKFATTFYASHEKSSLTCSAAPCFKTVTASLGHSFVLPTWKLIHRVHMTRKTSFCPLGQKLVFSSEACLTAREAALRAVKGLRREVSAEVCGTIPVTSCKARSFTAAPLLLHIAPCAILHFALCANLHEKTKRACYSRSRRCI